MTIILLTFFALALLLEGMITTLPVTLIALIILLLQKREYWIFFLAFGSGLLLDLFTLQSLGLTSIFFVIFLFALLLYERKYEIQTLPFVVVSSFFGSLMYLLIMRSDMVFWQSFMSSVIGGVAFILYSTYRKRHLKARSTFRR